MNSSNLLSMKMKNHLIITFIAIGAWSVFYLIGLSSNYFQNWNTSEQILLSMLTFFAAVPLISFITMVLLKQKYLKTGIWLAFYASFLLALIDFIICGLIQKGGFHIFISHWYLTLGYFYVWIICPLMGYSLEKFKEQIKK